MSAEDKPAPTAPPPSGAAEGDLRDKSSPSLDEVDSAWSDNDEDEGLDEDATMVAKVPHDLVALSRRGTELEKPKQEPEKHDAITARPPPPGEASVVVDAPHENVAKAKGATAASTPQEEDDEEDIEHDDDEISADELDAGWDIEEERAAAADVAAGLDAEARKKAAEERAARRKDKARSKKLAAKEKRKARADSIKLKQKKPKKRSTPPPREAASSSSVPPAKGISEARGSREHPTIPPKEVRPAAALSAARRDLIRMVLFVAIVVVIGAFAIGLSRR